MAPGRVRRLTKLQLAYKFVNRVTNIPIVAPRKLRNINKMGFSGVFCARLQAQREKLIKNRINMNRESKVGKPAKIAIIDDDPDVRLALETLLQENGFYPLPMKGSRDFFDLGENPDVDLALIDLRLSGESGLTLAIHIREHLDLPIVMLTGVGDEVDKIVGLEAGADDYLMKPFNPRELLARIRAVLRRYGNGHPPAQAAVPADHDTINFGDKLLDRTKRQLFDHTGAEIPLTNGEYRLLEVFLSKPDEIIPRADLLAQLGSDLSQYVDRTIDVLILRLRRKIESVPSKPVHLQTRRGLGYIFVRDPLVHLSSSSH